MNDIFIVNDIFVTANVFTVTTAIAGGLALGLVVKDSAEAMLEAFLHNGHINLLLRLIPLFILVFGTAIAVAFYGTAIMTDLISDSPNNIYRAAGRGLCNLIFVWSVAAGAWLRVRNLPH